MTDLALENCSRQQLSGASEVQHCSLQIRRTEENANNSNGQFIVLTNTKSRARPSSDICLFVNKSESQSFVHKSSISGACNHRSLVNNEIKSQRYFQLLKNYVNAVLVTKKLKIDLESLLEQSIESKQSGSKTSWDLSKVLNVLERYKADAKIIRALEIKLKSFLKSEMPFFAHSVAINFQGFYKFLYTTHNEVLVSIYEILDQELQCLHCLDSETLMNNESQQRVNLKHFAQLATRFEKLVTEVFSDIDRWCATWRDRTHGIVSKKGGLRNKCPFLYLKPLAVPHRLNNLWSTVTSMSIPQCLETVVTQRAINVSKDVITTLFNLIFLEENASSSKINGLTNNKKDKNIDTKRQSSVRRTKVSVKKSRNILFQELWKYGSQEVPLLSEIIDDMFQIHGKVFKNNFDLNHNDKLFEKTEESEQTNCIPSLSNEKLPNLAKKVHWDSSKDTKVHNRILDKYVELLWEYLAEWIAKSLLFGNKHMVEDSEKADMPFFCMSMENMSVTASFLYVKKLTSASGEIHPAFLQCVKEISSNVTYLFALQKWDYAMCSAQAKAIKDKCRTASDTSPRHSETMGLMLAALHSIQDLMELFTSNGKSPLMPTIAEPGNKKSRVLLDCLLAFSSTLQSSVDWLQSKSQQFVSSGSWQQFHLITVDDASALQEKLRVIIPNFALLARGVHCLENCDAFIIRALEDIQSTIGNIKQFNSSKNEILVQAIKARSDSSFKQHFPAAKQWRKRGATRLPLDPNLYMKLTTHQVLAPVIESVKCISQEDADEILVGCFSVFVTSLMDFILQEGMKFSFFGAHQLRLDFASLKDWIAQDAVPIPNESVSKILNSPSFSNMESAITLLCCQPEHRRRASSNGSDADTGSSLISSSSQGSFSGSLFEETIREVELPNKDQWLALRVKGNQNKSKLLCISTS